MTKATIGAKIETAKPTASKLSSLAESLQSGIKNHGTLNDSISESLGIKTYKAQGELLHAILEPHKDKTLEEIAKAMMELPADMRDGIDYGRTFFRWIAEGKPLAPTSEKKAELRTKLSALESGAKIRKEIMEMITLPANANKAMAIIKKLLETPDSDFAGLAKIKATL